MANKKPAKKQPAKKQAQKKAPAKKAPAKKQAVKKAAKKAQPKKETPKKAQPKKQATTTAASVHITYTPPAGSSMIDTANQTAYKVTEAVTRAVDTTIIRVQDVAKKTLRQRMLAWFKR